MVRYPLRLRVMEQLKARRPSPHVPLRVLYADASVVVVDKPSGLISLPGRGTERLVANAFTLLQTWMQGHPGAVLDWAAKAPPFPSLRLIHEKWRAANRRARPRLFGGLDGEGEGAAASVAEDNNSTSAPSRPLMLCPSLPPWVLESVPSQSLQHRPRAVKASVIPYILCADHPAVLAGAFYGSVLPPAEAEQLRVAAGLPSLPPTPDDLCVPSPLPAAVRAATPVEPLGVHRLDEGTSGVLVFALTYPVQRALGTLFQSGKAEGGLSKVYEAVLDTRLAEALAARAARKGGGSEVADENELPALWDASCVSELLTKDEGVITTGLQSHCHIPLIQEPVLPEGYAGSRPEAPPLEPGAGTTGPRWPPIPTPKPCVTLWKVLERGQGAVRVEFRPLTGRTHQLRLHAALPPPLGLGCPIVGDEFYGDPGLVERPYVLELLARAEAVKQQGTAGVKASDEATGSGGAAAVPTGKYDTPAFATSAELLLRDFKVRERLLAAKAREAAGLPPVTSDNNSDDGATLDARVAHPWLPRLPSCPYLSGEGPDAITPENPFVPRLLLHARELHLPDTFLGAEGCASRLDGIPEPWMRLPSYLARWRATAEAAAAAPPPAKRAKAGGGGLDLLPEEDAGVSGVAGEGEEEGWSGNGISALGAPPGLTPEQYLKLAQERWPLVPPPADAGVAVAATAASDSGSKPPAAVVRFVAPTPF